MSRLIIDSAMAYRWLSITQ